VLSYQMNPSSFARRNSRGRLSPHKNFSGKKKRTARRPSADYELRFA
jgi:hypothetical protein